MSEFEYPDYLTHDQVIAGVQRFYDILNEFHEVYQQEEQHHQKDTIAALEALYTDIFDAILCYKR